MEQEHLDKGAECPVLGPHYFAARAVAEKFMAQFDTAEHCEPVIKKAADDMYSALHERLEQFLLSDVENNLQGTIWNQIDESVKALLSGQRWALERYALGTRYDCDKIREAVAKHIPEELQNARIKELELEIERLQSDNRWLRRS
jgi:acylphosphatase